MKTASGYAGVRLCTFVRSQTLQWQDPRVLGCPLDFIISSFNQIKKSVLSECKLAWHENRRLPSSKESQGTLQELVNI